MVPMKTGKIRWQGVVLAVQPRIRLTRSFDQRQHSYLGYAIRVFGTVGDERREFLLGLGKEALAKHQLPRAESDRAAERTGLKWFQNEG